MDAYHELIELLTPVAEARILQALPRRRAHAGQVGEGDPEEGAGSGALRPAGRDLLATSTTRSAASRSFATPRLSDQFDAPVETRVVVGRMVAELLSSTPTFATLLEEPIPLEETLECGFLSAPTATPGPDRPRALPRGVRRVARRTRLAARRLRRRQRGGPGRLGARGPGRSRAPALGRRRDRAASTPRRTRPSASAEPHDPLQNDADAGASPLHLPEEALPHGRLPGPAPPHDAGIPPGADRAPLHRARLRRPALVARRERRRRLPGTWIAPGTSIGRLRALGVPSEFAAYLLPNAVIRFTESADLLGLRHKMSMRLC